MKRILAILMTVAMLMATLAVVIGAEELVTETVETEMVDVTTYYTVTSNLTNATCTNTIDTEVAEGGKYVTVIRPVSGYELTTLVVTVGGVEQNITIVSTGTLVNLTNVTGDIVITATAAEVAETEPAETEPAETEPAETEPAETEPAETEPAETEPAETEPAETEPAETEPAETEPSETEPVETEPAETEPAETEPAETEPTETEPAETEPAETEPAETEPAETEPAETEPAETEPAETEPAETEPMEEETTSAQAAAPVEPSTTAKEPPTTEPETQASLIPSDVANALIHATPEQLEAVKQYLTKGINALEEKTGWDRITDFLLAHVEELAWIVCAIAFVACMCVVMTAKKKFGLSATTMNNNAVEIAEKSERLVENMKNEAVNACREMKEQAHEAATQAGAALERFSAADEKNANAVSCLAVVVDELLQVSNLPQWKRDEIQTKFDEAMSHVSGHENGVSGDDAEG